MTADGAASVTAQHAARGTLTLGAPLLDTFATSDIIRVYEIATFYTMFHRHHVGKKYLMVCTNISCMLRGGYEVMAHIERRLGIKPGQTSKEGITLVEEECLAACADAPMAICERKYFLRLDEQTVDAMLDEIIRDAQAGRTTTEVA